MENWFILSLVAAIGFGLMTVLFKVLMLKGLSPLLTITYLFSIITLLLWFYVLSSQKIIIPNKEVTIILLVTAAIGVVANFAIIKAYDLASNPGYAKSVEAISIVIATIISIIAFSLRPDLFALIGVFLIFAGIILLSRAV